MLAMEIRQLTAVVKNTLYKLY